MEKPNLYASNNKLLSRKEEWNEISLIKNTLNNFVIKNIDINNIIPKYLKKIMMKISSYFLSIYMLI